MKTARLVIVAIAAITLVFGADVDGTWKATFQTPDGQTRENTITLKADGDKLTGTIASRIGESKLQNGTIKGDEVAFTAVRNFGGNDITFNYKGKITGNKMALKVSAGDRQFDMTAVKQ
jgi:hypothetical protein